MTFFNQDFLQFFMDLAGNNNKDWFDQNRKRYEVNVKDAFKNFVTHIITKLAEEDSAFKDLEASSCIFRINRDIRFSKDKTPYKMNVSAVVTPEGKKSKAINGVYFELGPEHVRVYGGVYEIDKDDLLTVREGIAKNPERFKKIYSEISFKSVFGEILGEKNKVIPKELKEAAEKEPLIYNKQWYFYKQFDSEVVLNENLAQLIIDCYRAGQPVENFFNELIKR
ncbi:MAG: DUF2461 domain-containing protein [Flavobacteriia bacterium]|nr:DUF2461 domain-containing protein [Flavobacteriia bacterium]